MDKQINVCMTSWIVAVVPPQTSSLVSYSSLVSHSLSILLFHLYLFPSSHLTVWEAKKSKQNVCMYVCMLKLPDCSKIGMCISGCQQLQRKLHLLSLILLIHNICNFNKEYDLINHYCITVYCSVSKVLLFLFPYL